MWHHSINNGAINYDLLDWWIRLDWEKKCSRVIILHQDTLMTSWELRQGWRIEFICVTLEWHTVSHLIISEINGAVDMIMLPCPNMVIFHCCYVITLKFMDLYCETLMSHNVTALWDIFNESFILMTHLASWKPLVRSRYLLSSCVTFKHLCSCSDAKTKTLKHDNLTLISMAALVSHIWRFRNCHLKHLGKDLNDTWSDWITFMCVFILSEERVKINLK